LDHFGDQPGPFQTDKNVSTLLSGISRNSGGIVSTTEINYLNDGDASQDRCKQCQYSREERSGVFRQPLPQGFARFVVIASIVTFFVTIGIFWVFGFIGYPDSSVTKPEDDTEENK